MDYDVAVDEIDQLMELNNPNHRIEVLRRRAGELEPGEDGRAEFLTSLGGDLELVGDIDGARDAIQAGIDDGGPTALEPRCGLVSIELAAGDDAAVDRVLGELLVKVRAGEIGVIECEWVAESLEDGGRLRQAHRWFTIPLRDIHPDDVDDLPRACLHGRWRVRRELDLPVDAYDEASELLRHTFD